MPLVSIVMSTYNRQDMLGKTIESVLNQSFSDFEFIIIDDKSLDNTVDIINSYNDKRIKLYKNGDNCGCTFNYHNAQNLSVGKFIAHIDDDDIWTPDKLEKQVDFLNQNVEITLVGSFIETFGENVRPSWVFDTDSTKIAFMMNFYNPLCHSSILYRKSFMLENGINYDMNKKCSQDYDFYKQIIMNGGKLSNLSEKLVKYRMHPKRLTDIKETQMIQVFNAENTKTELLSRFLNKYEINEVKNLMIGFPFNKYNVSNVIKAIDLAGKKYTDTFFIDKNIIEEVKNDIKSGVYSF